MFVMYDFMIPPPQRLDALDSNAYAAFQASHDLQDVVDRVMGARGGEGGVVEGGASSTPRMKKSLSIRATLMTPVKPMLVSLSAIWWFV